MKSRRVLEDLEVHGDWLSLYEEVAKAMVLDNSVASIRKALGRRVPNPKGVAEQILNWKPKKPATTEWETPSVLKDLPASLAKAVQKNARKSARPHGTMGRYDLLGKYFGSMTAQFKGQPANSYISALEFGLETIASDPANTVLMTRVVEAIKRQSGQHQPWADALRTIDLPENAVADLDELS